MLGARKMILFDLDTVPNWYASDGRKIDKMKLQNWPKLRWNKRSAAEVLT